MYCNSAEIWKYLGKDAYTKVRSEVVGTGAGLTASYELDHDNVITSSVTLYTGSTAVTSSYTLDLDDGDVSGLLVPSGSVLTADYDYADIADSVLAELIGFADSLIDTETGRIFASTTTTEYLNVDSQQRVFFLKNWPVITLTSVERNLSIQTATPEWETMTVGLGLDYISNSEDLALGRIRWIDNFPYTGDDMVRVVYTHGYATTPVLVKELSMLLTLRQLSNSTVYKSIVKGYDNFTPVRLDEIENRIEELKKVLKKQSVESV